MANLDPVAGQDPYTGCHLALDPASRRCKRARSRARSSARHVLRRGSCSPRCNPPECSASKPTACAPRSTSRLGLPGYHLVGLGAGAVKEGGVRVRAALDHSGFKLPPRKVTINLAPADVRKDGAAFDLPIAVGVLAAQELVPQRGAATDVLIDRGAVARRQLAARRRRAADRALRARARRARRDPAARLRRRGGRAFARCRCWRRRRCRRWRPTCAASRRCRASTELPPHERDAVGDADLADVRGLEYVKLALEVAAAGSHNLLLIGAPGSGKSMLARRLPTILPPLDEDEALQTSMIYSAAGKLDGASLIRRRPFRAPHQDVSLAGLRRRRLGRAQAGRDQPRAQRRAVPRRAAGDEAHRAGGAAPAARGAAHHHRARAPRRSSFPPSFALVAAMNPCPCGYYGSLAAQLRLRHAVACAATAAASRGRCSTASICRSRCRRSTTTRSPIRARGEPSATVRERVLAAREHPAAAIRRQRSARQRADGPAQIAAWCRLDGASSTHLGRIVQKRGISARGVHRILRVARTIADLKAKRRDRTGSTFNARSTFARSTRSYDDRDASSRRARRATASAAHRPLWQAAAALARRLVDRHRRRAPVAPRRQLHAHRRRAGVAGAHRLAGAAQLARVHAGRPADPARRPIARCAAAPSTPAPTTTCFGCRSQVALRPRRRAATAAARAPPQHDRLTNTRGRP